jgi:hypothetical protein
MTLEDILSQEISHQSGQTGAVSYHPDVRIEVLAKASDGVHISLHQMGQNGASFDFVVKGNQLTPMGYNHE